MVLAFGLVACGDAPEISSEEQAYTVPVCQVTSQTDNTQTGKCYNGSILTGGCIQGRMTGIPKPVTMPSGVQIFVNQTACNVL